MRNFNTKMSIFITKFAKKHSCKFLHDQAEPYHVTLSEFDNELLIICGDCNFVQNPEIDYYNYLHINNPRARKVVLDSMEENSLVDVWRLLNEDVRAYTWKRINPVRKQARLDYFLINETCLEYVILILDIEPFILPFY